MRKFLKVLSVILVILAVFVVGFERLYLLPRFSIPVIMYHKINDAPSKLCGDPVSPANFEYHMSYLKAHHFKVISVDEYVQGLKSGKHPDNKTVVITFDDGYEDNFTEALPIIKKYNFPVTIFLCPGFIGQPGYLTWKEVAVMRREPLIHFGSHTINHVYLPGATPEVQRRELTESKRILEEKLGMPIKYLAYPLGGYNEEVKRLAAQIGYEAAFTTNRGTVRVNRDLLTLQRIRLPNYQNSGFVMGYKLNGYRLIFRKMKPPSEIIHPGTVVQE